MIERFGKLGATRVVNRQLIMRLGVIGLDRDGFGVMLGGLESTVGSTLHRVW